MTIYRILYLDDEDYDIYNYVDIDCFLCLERKRYNNKITSEDVCNFNKKHKGYILMDIISSNKIKVSPDLEVYFKLKNLSVKSKYICTAYSSGYTLMINGKNIVEGVHNRIISFNDYLIIIKDIEVNNKIIFQDFGGIISFNNIDDCKKFERYLNLKYKLKTKIDRISF